MGKTGEEIAEKITHMLRDAVMAGLPTREAADVLMACLIPMIYATGGSRDDALQYVEQRTRELWAATKTLMAMRPSAPN